MSPIYKTKNGYVVKINYTDSEGNYKQVCRSNNYTKTKSDAKIYEQQLLQELKENKQESNNITLDELYNSYIEYKKGEDKNSSIRNIRLTYKHYVGSLRSKHIYSITHTDWIKWKNNLNKKPLKTITKQRIFGCFVGLLNYGVKFYGLQKNLLSELGNFKDNVQVENETIKYWTYEEFKRFQYALLLECGLKKEELSILWWSLYVTYNVLFFCGLRKGEALALNWSDLIVKNGIYYLSITKSINEKVQPYEITKPKNKSSVREVPVCDELQKILFDHKERCKKIFGFNESFYICGSLLPVSETYLCTIKNEFSRKAGVPQIRIHDFRHSYISLLINAGLPLSSIARLVGHSTTDITQKIYTHIYPETSLQSLDILNNLKKC